MSLVLDKLDYRIPDWDLADLVNRDCPLCGTAAANEAMFVRPDGLMVNCCKGCQTYFVSPAPSATQIGAFYANYDAVHRKTGKLRIDATKLWRFYGVDYDADFRLRELSSLIELSGADILDIGFGIPRFLYEAGRRGANVYGLEFDAQAVEYARRSGIENVYLGTVGALPKGLAFDAIILNDLVEHPLAPLDVLQSACSVLKPGGRLLIWTPNGGAIERHPSPVTLRVDLEHMQYFTSHSLHVMAGRLGCEIEHLETLGFPAVEALVAPRPSRSSAFMFAARSRIKVLPGIRALLEYRRCMSEANLRRGDYHLFAILRKF